MNTIPIDAGRAMALLTEVVAGREDHVYEKHMASPHGACLYVDPATQKPSCLVGHVLFAAGWTPADFAEYEGMGVICLAETSPQQITEAAGRVLEVAQQAQDKGNTWGESVSLAQAVWRDLDG